MKENYREEQRKNRERNSTPAQHVVCRGPGRFHNGTPSNGLTVRAMHAKHMKALARMRRMF